MKYTLALITALGMERRASKVAFCELEGFQQVGYTKGPAYAQVKVLVWGHKGVLQIQVMGCLSKKVFKSKL